MSAEGAGDVGVVVRRELSRLLSRQPAPAGSAVTDKSVLAEVGVGSLDLLELSDVLETVLQVNPFDAGVSLTDVRTVGDLCAAYRAAVEGQSARSTEVDDLLQASRKRAEARRRHRAI